MRLWAKHHIAATWSFGRSIRPEEHGLYWNTMYDSGQWTSIRSIPLILLLGIGLCAACEQALLYLWVTKMIIRVRPSEITVWALSVREQCSKCEMLEAALVVAGWISRWRKAYTFDLLMLMAWISNLSVQACVMPLCVGSCAPVDRCDVGYLYSVQLASLIV